MKKAVLFDPQFSVANPKEKFWGISTNHRFTRILPQKKPADLPQKKREEITAELLSLKPSEFFRLELDVRKAKNGHRIYVKKRLRFSEAKPSRQIGKVWVEGLTPKQIQALREGRLSKTILQKLSDSKGDIKHEHWSIIAARMGRGNGARRSDLDARSKLLLARFERMLLGRNRGGSVDPGEGNASLQNLPQAQRPDLDTEKPVSLLHQ